MTGLGPDEGRRNDPGGDLLDDGCFACVETAALRTRSPTDNPVRPLLAVTSIVATVGRTNGSGPAPGRGGCFVFVRAGG